MHILVVCFTINTLKHIHELHSDSPCQTLYFVGYGLWTVIGNQTLSEQELTGTEL